MNNDFLIGLYIVILQNIVEINYGQGRFLLDICIHVIYFGAIYFYVVHAYVL